MKERYKCTNCGKIMGKELSLWGKIKWMFKSKNHLCQDCYKKEMIRFRKGLANYNVKKGPRRIEKIQK